MAAEFPRHIWDPGKTHNLSTLHILNSLIPNFKNIPPMHKTGNVIIHENTYFINECLFDTGAKSDNFIAKTYVNKNCDIFAEYITPHDCNIRLGDSTTTVHISEIITLTVTFVDANFISHEATLNFLIMPITHIDMIIGINSILYSLFDFFIDMLRIARLNIKLYNTPTLPAHLHNINHSICDTNDIPKHADYHDCVPMWTQPIDNIAPEELEIPELSNFGKALYLLSNTREDILNDYYALLTTNISADMVAARPDILTFMKGPLALKVFCPKTWTGINGLKPLELKFSAQLPARRKPSIRPIKPALLENSRSEYDRLSVHMYVKSDSPIASALVIAPKPTPPFQRWCGDYVWINKWIEFHQNYVPIVFHELEKAAKGKMLCDLDMKNAFHQIVLAEFTSKMLTIVTPWGAVRPLFMPEGISPASGILHQTMVEILADILDTSIAIFDNFLIICDSYDDVYNKLVKFITICAERNVILGMSKSKIGFTKCVFFGYEIADGKYQLTQARKDSVASLVFPQTVKQVQSFLGSTIFFRNNIVNFADKCAPLNDMTKKGFSFAESTWTKDYKGIFESFKSDILNAITVTFPDYDLTFILRTDASKDAWGGVLLQVTTGGTYECISLASAKFSDSAYRWDIQKKETYAVVASIKHMQYILTGKYFIIEIDNKNATYLNTETSSIVTRWRQYIQTFNNCLRFIPGKFNTSDWLTRQYESSKSHSNIIKSSLNDDETVDQHKYISQVLAMLVDIEDQVEDTPPNEIGGTTVTILLISIKKVIMHYFNIVLIIVINNDFIHDHNIINILKENN